MCPAVCVGLGILLAFHWDTRASRLCVRDSGPDGRAAQMGLLIPWFLLFLVQKKKPHRVRVYCTEQYSSAKWDGLLRRVQECLLSVLANSTERLFTTKSSPSLFLYTGQKLARISVKSALMMIWLTCPRSWLARICASLSGSSPLRHIRIQRLSSLLLECAQ